MTTAADTCAAAALLRATSGSVLVRGGGTAMEWAGRVKTPDLVLDTSTMTGLLTHNPADLTASVRAGTRLDDLQQELARDGQWLAFDPPAAGLGATVGGLLAAGDSGPARLRYGALRDLVIGVTLVLADGTVGRSGGHVIKNVAGYDLAKLAYGSLGSLAVITEVVVRLHPLPATTSTLSAPCSARAAQEVTLALLASPLEPAALEWCDEQMLVRLEGTEVAVGAAADGVRALLADHGLPPERLDGPAADGAWRQQRAAVLGSADETVLRVAARPGDLHELLTTATAAARLYGVTVHAASSTGLGLTTLRLAGPEDALSGVASTVEAVRAVASRLGGSALLRRRPTGLDALVDPLGPPPSTLALLRRIKDAFDPDGRLAPGRFHPWY